MSVDNKNRHNIKSIVDIVYVSNKYVYINNKYVDVGFNITFNYFDTDGDTTYTYNSILEYGSAALKIGIHIAITEFVLDRSKRYSKLSVADKRNFDCFIEAYPEFKINMIKF